MHGVRYPVVELRQYTLRPGQREVLIELFDREFVESQEATGMAIVGQFRDLDQPDRFVWIRGFPSMPVRARALAGFYGGPRPQAHTAPPHAPPSQKGDMQHPRPGAPPSGETACFAACRRCPPGHRSNSSSPPPPDPCCADDALPVPRPASLLTCSRWWTRWLRFRRQSWP